jgi:hypothetical protein
VICGKINQIRAGSNEPMGFISAGSIGLNIQLLVAFFCIFYNRVVIEDLKLKEKYLDFY